MQREFRDFAIEPQAAECFPGLRVHAVLLTGLANGVGSKALEPLRKRVVDAVRDRVRQARDPARLARIAALNDGLRRCGVGRSRSRAALDDAIRAAARGDPFPVADDATDLARLVSLYYVAPASVHDAGKVEGPLRLRIAPAGLRARGRVGADVDLSDRPVLCDRGGVLASPVADVARHPPTRQTTEALLLVTDLCRDDPIDPAELVRRVENWYGGVTRARVADAFVADSPAG